MKIAHLTSAHPRYDTRIFLKECRSLAIAGYSVHLVVADGKGEEIKELVSIHDVGRPIGRLNRMITTTQRVYERAVKIDAEIYHLHDPELLPVGLRLKRLGKKVIFDAHEDLPKQLMGKPYLNKVSRTVLSNVFRVFERLVCKRFDAIVTATPFITEKFQLINSVSVTVNNFPLLGELSGGEIDWSEKTKSVSYIGGIASIRGISQVVSAMALVKSGARLQLGGRFSESSVEVIAKADPGWERVDELGFIDREGVRDALSRSVAGLVTFLPAPNHVDAQPNKMFEYMSAGVPVIASNFPLWREIIEGNSCGVCVDPLQPRQIAEAVDYLIENPDLAEEMGRSGQRAVHEKYNWSIEEKALLGLYDRLAKKRNSK
ncbi:glycosyltransferase family 4 protein [Pseudomonas sp. BBP2017]|uniref:glycosyltransferase family 4 protein n=1 Tax=Pseudomonas sp. BBP2017 TaxID=2109731 RepID=UPI000D129140|nr:glycosyltransferase family 4 protein [Pseudomonas sp. BBP2017]PSS47912.1 glycosyl transferase [Pseudomonas sp. BBP2017]